jgi:hypothetical protein
VDDVVIGLAHEPPDTGAIRTNEFRAWLAQQQADGIDSFEARFRNPQIELPDPPDEVLALTLQVTLRRTTPKVWRRLVVPATS